MAQELVTHVSAHTTISIACAWCIVQLTQTEAHTLTDALARRCQGEPLAYITATREFWSRDFVVTPSTLIPRSDSEVLIETLVEQYPAHAALRILDIGTGSGCLLVTALGEFPHASGVGIDISSDALAVAEQNAERHSVLSRATFLQQDLRVLPALLQQHHEEREGSASSDVATLFQQFDVILCNPPYIPRNELHLVAPDVLAHEPHLALFSDGPNAAAAPESYDVDDDPLGLQMYQSLQQSVVHLLARDRQCNQQQQQCVVLEVGSEAQAHAVQALFASPPSCLNCERVLFDSQQRHRGLLLSRCPE